MAIKYKDMAIRQDEIERKLREDPLTETELMYVSQVEAYIDGEIEEKYDGGAVFIFLQYANFTRDPFNKVDFNIKFPRKHKMYKELKKRYKKAGWKCREELDDGLDGPNMSGSDYFILTGKNK